MNLDNLPLGENVPHDINVVIKIPSHGSPAKYEVDKDNGTLTVDRFMGTAMFYPCNYGFMSHTPADDGDPRDVLVVTPVPHISSSVIRCRPIGMLKMIDEAGEDHKVLAGPFNTLTKLYDDVKSPFDLHDGILEQITHFFEQYKALDSGKWVKVESWAGVEEAEQEIFDGTQRYNSQ